MRSKYLWFLASAALSTQVFASDSTAPTPALDQAEALALDAQHYASSYGVSETEAMRRLLIMHGTREQVAQVEQQYAGSLSGIYFDNSADFGLKVRVTGEMAPPNQRLVKKAAKVAVKEERVARRAERKTLRQRAGLSDQAVEAAEDLIGREVSAEVKFQPKGKETRGSRQRKIQERQAELKRQIPALELVVDNETTGQAIVYVKTDPGETKAKAEAILGVEARVVVVPTGFHDVHTRGGSVLRPRGSQSHYCMTAFVAKRNGTETMGAITAGHCVDNDPLLNYTDKDTSSYPIDRVDGMWVNSASADLAFMTADHVAVNQFYADNTATPRTLTTDVWRSEMKVRATNVNGAYICHLGQTSPTDATLMQSCGEVISISGPRVGYGGNTFVHVTNTGSGAGTTRTAGTKGTLRCVRGDSGGPWFAYTSAYGVMSQCTWVDTGETITETAIFTSVEYIPAISANLVF